MREGRKNRGNKDNKNDKNNRGAGNVEDTSQHITTLSSTHNTPSTILDFRPQPPFSLIFMGIVVQYMQDRLKREGREGTTLYKHMERFLKEFVLKRE